MCNRLTETRVAILQPCLPHYRVPFFAELNRRMADRVIVLAGPHSFGGSPRSVEQAPGVNWIQVENLFLGNQFVIQKLPRWAVRADIVVLSFDLRTLSNLYLFARRKRLNLPVILWGHGFSSRLNSPQWVRRLRVWWAHQADAVIFYSDKGKQDFVRAGLPANKLFVAHNSIDLEAIRQAAAKCNAERRDILFIGRLVPAKKADVLIQAFKYAQSRLPTGTRLIIVGDGPERTRLELMAQEMQVAHAVEFVGEKTDETELAPLFARSIVCVSPGYIGLSAIHSLAYGVPILVSDNEPHSPEIEALVPGKNGEYFPANDPTVLADRLVEMLSQPDRLIEMGLHGQALVQSKYSVQNMANVFFQAFKYVTRNICQ